MQTYAIAGAVMMLSWMAAAWPARALACECLPDPIYHAQPKAGATGVPLDIAPVIEGPFDPTSIRFEDERGAELTFALNLGPRNGCLGGWAELLPSQPLAANTRYTIRVAALYPGGLTAEQRIAAVSFTTGSEQLADETLLPPRLSAASVLRGARDCGGLPTTFACIGGLEEEAPRDLELIALRGDEVLLRVTSLIRDDGTYGIAEPPDCIELRRRAADGRRSEPSRICGAALLTRDYRKGESETEGWVACHAGILGDPAAYDESSDAGPPVELAHDAATTSDASIQHPAEPTPSDSGCHVTAGRGDLRALPFALGCAVLLRRSRRRRRS